MKKYNKFYYIHIQRTGGRYLFENVINQLYKSEQIELLNYNKNQGDMPHNGWVDEIDQDTYVMTIFREPLELICSHYVYFGLTGDCVTEEEYTKENLFKFIAKNPQVHNLQSKSLILTSKTYADLVLKSALYQKINLDILNEKLERINFSFTLDYLKENSLESISDKISSDIGISPFFNKEDSPGINNFSHPRSRDLYESLNEDDRNNLTRYFEGDYYIYNKIRAQELAV